MTKLESVPMMFKTFAPESVENRTALKLLRKFESEAWMKSRRERELEVLDHLKAGLGDTLASSVRITMRADGRDLLVECLQRAQGNGAVEELFQAADMATGEALCPPTYLCDFVEWLVAYR